MSQITRCPSCQTCFKVVADQLRISDGWVRCGHCKQVFDATEQLQQVPPTALMPDLPLDSLRAPAQPVARSAEPVHVWGTARHPSGNREPAPAVTAPQAMAERLDPVSPLPPFLPAESSQSQAPGPEMPAISEHRAVPAFLAKDAGEPVLASPFAWRAPVAAPPPGFVDTSLAEPRAMAPGLGATLVGYELPGAVGPEADILGAQEVGEIESGADPSASPEPAAVLGASEPQFEPAADQTLAAQTASTMEVPDIAPSAPEADLAEEAVALELVPDALAPAHSWAAREEHPAPPPPASTDDFVDGDSQFLDSVAASQVAGALPADSAVVEPSFVRAARRRDFWRKPLVRVVLGGLCAVLCGLLFLQVALQQRSWLAAAQPQWRPLLSDLCGLLHCELGPYRDISAVVVDSSSFNKARGDGYQFALTLKNHSSVALETPAIELTLTDAQDQPVLRRVLFASDLAAPVQLAARGDWSASVPVRVSVPGARIAGYRVLAFYP